MAEEFESVELEYSEDDILYYLEDEDGNEIGFALEEDGKPVEYFYEGFDAADYELVKEAQEETAVEIEIDEDAILYYLEDEDGNEIGFVIEEDGKKVECYYEEEPASSGSQEKKVPAEPEEPKERGYLSKIASIAGYHGNKARKKAGVELNKVRGVAEKQVDKATVAVKEGGKKLKAKKDETDLGISREDVSQATKDLNVIAKEGAATIKELKGSYDDLMDEFGFLVPNKIKRKLPK